MQIKFINLRLNQKWDNLHLANENSEIIQVSIRFYIFFRKTVCTNATCDPFPVFRVRVRSGLGLEFDHP